MDERSIPVADPSTAPAVDIAAPARWAQRFPMLESLSYRDFRWMWVSSFASFMAMNMQLTAAAWLVLRITDDSPLALTWIMVSFAVPVSFVALISGALADRIPRRRLVILSQLANAIITLVLAALDLAGIVDLRHLIVILLVKGALQALNMPSRQAMVSEVVPERKLMNAISLSNSGMSITRMAGPAAAGFLIVLIGTHGTFFFIAGVYTLAALSVPMVNAGRLPMARSGKGVAGDIGEGLAYTMGSRALRGNIIVGFIAVIFGSAYWTLLAAWAREVLDVGADGLGILNSATGVGAVVGSLILASITGFKKPGELLLVVCLIWAVAIAIFSQTGSFALALPLLAIAGLFSAMFMSLNMTMMQLNSTVEMRGRVMSISMVTWGLMPLGAVPFGVIASAVDTAFAFTLSGVLLAVSVVAFWIIYPSGPTSLK